MATHLQTMLSAACFFFCVPVALYAEPLQTWPVESSSILKLAYSPDGQHIATAPEEGKAKVLRRESGGVAATFDLNRGESWGGLVWSPDSQLLAAGGTQAQREQATVNLPPASKPIMPVAFSQQGERIVMGSGESSAQVIVAGYTDGQLQGSCPFTCKTRCFLKSTAFQKWQYSPPRKLFR